MNKLRIYADGVFDLFHYGHAKLFEQIKLAYPDSYLIVGLCSDEDILKHKGITVFNENERYETLRHCKWVDEIIRNAPWIPTEDFMNKYNIDFIAHDGAPYIVNGKDDAYSVPKKLGKFIETTRTEGISTTDIINRILNKSIEYHIRNNSRN